MRGTRALLQLNQKGGFDCPGCAWPDPERRATAEFCENGARAAAHEADSRKVDAAFFAQHSLSLLREQTDHWLEQQGRLVQPMVRRAGCDHYEPIAWPDAFSLVSDALHRSPGPDRAVFYTSGRASNEAAFLYQLFARCLGTNNLPDCSNMCHESSGKALQNTLGVGKGTVQLNDFEHSDCILIIGQNPGTNHPRMLSTLAAAARRGATIIAVNPLRERALESFAHPQELRGMLGVGVKIASQHVPVRINGDVALFKGIMKLVLAADRAQGGSVIDHDFVAAHTSGFEALVAGLDSISMQACVEGSGVPLDTIEKVARSYMESRSVIACWAMGMTQHENAVDNIREVVNLLLLRGNVGRPGAGVCPVRGHSNVQGDRTMGIHEAPSEAFLRGLERGTGVRAPREHGLDVVGSIHALEQGTVDVFVALGGNFVAATPDTARVQQAMSRAGLTVQISTKLNRSHLHPGETALILPCLGRSERDLAAGKAQFVTVENSMSVVHRSQGRLTPAGEALRSEVAIVVAMAQATLGSASPVEWQGLCEDYDRIRDLIEACIPGFERFNERVRGEDGFVLPNSAREREWDTPERRAVFTRVELPGYGLASGQLMMMTLRSHDQFNTTIYDLDDRYRGVHGERKVIFMNPDDLRARGLKDGDWLDLIGVATDQPRTLRAFRALAYDIPSGCCATYFPEGNPLVPLDHLARESRTPASKSVPIRVRRSTR